MSDAANETPDGYMKDSRGALVPTSKVKPEHIEEDALVRALVERAEGLSDQLAAFKASALGNVAAYCALIDEKYNVKRGGKKGNMTLRSYDGSMVLNVAIGETISFGAELEAAKKLIDKCVMRWSEGSGDEIKALVTHAFQTNKQGKIDTGRVLGLKSLNIEDDEWKRAMEAISDAVRVVGSKTYFRVYKVDPETGARVPISLDLANA